MPTIIHIETSTNICSVALSVDSVVRFEKVSFDGPSHAALASVFTEEMLAVLKAADLRPDAVAVSSGPGSYTGLRIGISLAKGLCFGYDIPLISLSTLELLAYTAIQRKLLDSAGLYCPMIDARRMEVYSAVYDAALSPVRKTVAEVITPESYRDILEKAEICFFGNGAAKCKEVISSPRAFFIDDIHPLAANMTALAEKAYEQQNFVDVAYFEPNYLKEFQATIAKNKVLGDIGNKQNLNRL